MQKAKQFRDCERTPMQWNSSTNAGFSSAKPWLPVPDSAKAYNVESESKDPSSILNFYKAVLALRHQDPALLEGKYVPLNESDPNVLSYLRQYKDEAVLVVVNMSSSAQKASFDLASSGSTATQATTLLSTLKSRSGKIQVSSIALDPFGVFIGKLSR